MFGAAPFVSNGIPTHHSFPISNRNQSVMHFFSLCDETRPREETTVARTNYKFQKRQKELERKRKKEEKRQARMDAKIEKSESSSDASSSEEDPE